MLLALIVCPFAAAGEVYKCKGPKGDITFTNIKCPEHTAIEHYATYQPEEEPPPPPPPAETELPKPPVNASSVQPTSEPANPSAARAPGPPPAQVSQPSTQAIAPQAVAAPLQQPDRPIVQEPARAEQPTSVPSTTLASGYKCSDGNSTWLQSTPCPPTSARAPPRPIERPSADALPATSPTESKPVAPPHETGSSQGPLCDQLISQAATAGHQPGGTGTEELNKLLAANGCRQ